ncbi:MAG: 1,2-diacylglycerol 3-alpha-glucosyltransferase [Candidatus Marinamargulisbacteria bacterium]|jgi:1,2-diacylglycerol 3-alpha-glucosyltransferase
MSSPPLKIAIFTETYLPQVNGVVTSIQTLTRELEKQGHQVLIISPKIEGATKSTNKVWRFRSMTYPFQPEHRMTSPFSRKLRDFKAMEFDVIHVQTPIFMGYLGQYLSWKHDIPMVHTYHTFWEKYLHYFPLIPKKMAKRVNHMLLSRRFCNRCEHVVVPSNQMKEQLVKDGVEAPLTVIPTGVDFEKVVQIGDPSTFREVYKIPKKDKVLIFVGRLGKEKNVYFLLNCLHRILKKNPDTTLFIAGDGPEKCGLLAQAKSLGIDHKVCLPGYLSHQDIFTAYAASDIITFASKTETQGLSLIEGLAMGTPAVCIDAFGVKDIVENNKGGFLTKDDETDFSNKVLDLLNDPKLYEKKAEEALERAESFRPEEMAKKMISVYKLAIKARQNKKKEGSK